MSEPLPPLGQSVPLVPPLYQSSVYTLPDLDALDRIMDARAPGFIYARDGHPNARQLADQLAHLEGAKWSIICGSGMAAISAVVLGMVGHGDRIIASNRLYGRTTQLFMEELPRFGVTTTLVDSNDLDAVRTALQQPARLLFVETMSNPLLRIVDIQELVDLADKHDCHLVVDNTFATPVLCRPLDYGADFVMESLTKMIGGHSDVTLGLLCGRNDFLPEITRTVSIFGSGVQSVRLLAGAARAFDPGAADEDGVGQCGGVGRLAGRAARCQPCGLSGPHGPSRSRTGVAHVGRHLRQHALLRVGRWTRGRQSLHAPAPGACRSVPRWATQRRRVVIRERPRIATPAPRRNADRGSPMA